MNCHFFTGHNLWQIAISVVVFGGGGAVGSAVKLVVPFDHLISLGDSWIDDGVNFARDDYWGFWSNSDGQVFPYYLSEWLGIPQMNYGFSGALSDQENYGFDGQWSGLSWQVEEVLKTSKHDRRKALLIYESGGANDLWKDKKDLDQILVNNYNNLRRLLANGFRSLILLDIQDLSRYPYYQSEENAAVRKEHHSAALKMNGDFAAKVVDPLREEFKDAQILFVPSKPLVDQLFQAFPNNTEPFSRKDGQTPEDRFTYLFHDGFHLNSKPHHFIAEKLKPLIVQQFAKFTTRTSMRM